MGRELESSDRGVSISTVKNEAKVFPWEGLGMEWLEIRQEFRIYEMLGSQSRNVEWAEAQIQVGQTFNDINTPGCVFFSTNMQLLW